MHGAEKIAPESLGRKVFTLAWFRLHRVGVNQLIGANIAKLQSCKIAKLQDPQTTRLGNTMSADISREEWLHLLQTSVESAAHGIVISSRDGQIIWTNPAFTEMTGYPRSEIIGENPRILKSGVQDDAFYREMWSTLLDGRTWRGEIVNRRRDGSLYTERQSIRPVCFQGDEITHFIAIKEDISEQKKLQSKLIEMDRLAAVGSLAAGVAHEINNPLAFIRSNLEVLASRLDDRDGAATWGTLSVSEVRDIIADAVDGTRRIQETVTNLRTFSAHERQRPVEAVDLKEAVESALRMVSNQIQSRARLIRKYAPGEVRVLANESQLIQVFLNLLINATHAISQDTDNEIRVCVGRSGHSPVVEVSDTGTGIAPEVLPHIFEPFFTTKSQDDGTGMGLSVCRNIVRKMGARLEVESQHGVGSTFRITFPSVDATQTSISEPSE